MPVAGLKGSFLFIALNNTHVMVRIADINFGEVLSAPEPIESFANQVLGVPILLRDQVETPLVDTQAETTILFQHEKDRGTGRK